MTYIWNRAEKVDKELMPQVVEEAFNKWVKEQYKGFSDLSEERKGQINYKVLVQMGKKNYNLKQLGYDNLQYN
jgi:hypothetical protein